MRLHRTTLSAALVLLLAGTTRAQDGSSPDQPQQPAKALTDKDKADEGSKAIAVMRDELAQVNKLVDDAREERDALRLNCVNERKTQMAGLVKVAELSIEELKAASKDRQSEAVDHEYSKIMLAKGKVDSYKTEAEQCIGSLRFYDATDKVERDFKVQGDLPSIDGITPEPVPPPVFKPPAASPVK